MNEENRRDHPPGHALGDLLRQTLKGEAMTGEYVMTRFTDDDLIAIRDVAVFEQVSRERAEIATMTNCGSQRWKKIREALETELGERSES